MSSPIFWTPDKDKVIYLHYPDGGAIAVMPHLEGVSHGRIKNRAGVLGVKMTEKAKRAALATSVRRVEPPSDTMSRLSGCGGVASSCGLFILYIRQWHIVGW